MTFPPRTLVTLVVIAVLLGVALWAVFVLLRMKGSPLTPSQKMAVALVVVSVMGGLIAWVIFVLPAYWD